MGFNTEDTYTLTKEVKLSKYEIDDIRQLYENAGRVLCIKWVKKLYDLNLRAAVDLVDDICGYEED
jgi:hypothetical protein